MYLRVDFYIEKRYYGVQSKPRNYQLQCFLEDLYERYKIPLLRIVHKHIGNSDIGEDLFHEIFIRIIRSAEKLYTFPKPKLEAYIFLIAKGVSIDYLRKTYNNVQVDITDDVLLNLLAAQEKTTSSTFDKFEKVNLTILLKQLSIEDQMLLLGKYYLGLSINDLVSLMGGTSTAIRSKLHRAKKKVFQEWTQSGLKMEDFINE